MKTASVYGTVVSMHLFWGETMSMPVKQSDAYTLLIQMMACRLVGAKSFSRPMLAYCYMETNVSELCIQM